MDARVCLTVALINCVIIQYSASKPFSLNEVIAEEAQQIHESETRGAPSYADIAGEQFSLNEGLTSPSKTRKFKKTESILPRSKTIISPLKYRRAFQIKSPLKPKKLKYSPRARHHSKNQSYKREISENDIFNPKYIPLLRSVGMLFDNLLGPDTSDSYEEKYKFKRTRYYSGERDETECPCATEYTSNIESGEETDTFTTSSSIEISSTTEIPSDSEVTTAPTDNTAPGDLGSLEQHKDVSILLSRDSLSGWRDHNGFSEGSSATHNRSIEGYISRIDGNSEHIPGNREKEPNTESYEGDTDGDPRDGTGGNGRRKRLREYRADTREADETIGFEVYESKNETEGARDANEHQGENQLEVVGDQTESAEYLSKPVRKLRGAATKTETETITELPTTVREESFGDVTLDSSRTQRVFNRSSKFTTENKEIYPRHEELTLIKEATISNNSKNNTPVVVIIGGYSMMRNRNGEKKLARKAIHISPK